MIIIFKTISDQFNIYIYIYIIWNFKKKETLFIKSIFSKSLSYEDRGERNPSKSLVNSGDYINYD